MLIRNMRTGRGGVLGLAVPLAPACDEFRRRALQVRAAGRPRARPLRRVRRSVAATQPRPLSLTTRRSPLDRRPPTHNGRLADGLDRTHGPTGHAHAELPQRRRRGGGETTPRSGRGEAKPHGASRPGRSSLDRRPTSRAACPHHRAATTQRQDRRGAIDAAMDTRRGNAARQRGATNNTPPPCPAAHWRTSPGEVAACIADPHRPLAAAATRRCPPLTARSGSSACAWPVGPSARSHRRRGGRCWSAVKRGERRVVTESGLGWVAATDRRTRRRGRARSRRPALAAHAGEIRRRPPKRSGPHRGTAKP